MKNLLLILLFLIILPVSNEQIQQNMGFLQPLIVLYLQLPLYFQASGPAKAPWRLETYKVTAADGTVFIIKYRTVAGSFVVYDVDDCDLGLDSWYLTKDDLISAINKTIQEYNMSVPIGTSLFCLLLFGNLYLIYVWYKLCRLGKIDCRRLD